MIHQAAAHGRITGKTPGVAFIKKDGEGKERGIIPVADVVYRMLASAHNGKTLELDKLDVDKLDDNEKIRLLQVVKNVKDFGHVYIRNNRTSKIYYL